MKKIELIWNILYYFIYKAYNAILSIFKKILPDLEIYNIKNSRAITIIFILGLFFAFDAYCILQATFRYKSLSIGLLILLMLLSTITSYLLLVYKNKCLIYFEQFEKKSFQWKKKWRRLSILIIFLILLSVVGCAKFMDYALHPYR
jgi:hypothetical protein